MSKTQLEYLDVNLMDMPNKFDAKDLTGNVGNPCASEKFIADLKTRKKLLQLEAKSKDNRQ